jgi:RNA polymerase sigma factor FliA
MNTQAQRDELVLQHLYIVRTICCRLVQSLPPHVDADDLKSAGVVGLIHAAKEFDRERGVSFFSFAKHRIKGAMLDFLRSLDWASREDRRLINEIDNMREGDGQFSPKQAAELLGVSEQRIVDVLAIERCNAPVSIDSGTTLEDGEEYAPFQLAAAPESRPDSMYSAQEISDVLRCAMEDALPPRYQMVIELYYAGEMTMREIGQALNCNESRVSQIHKGAILKLRETLLEQGRDASYFAAHA